MIDLLPYPSPSREKSIMLSIGFTVDNILIKRVSHFSCDGQIEKELIEHLEAISKLTLVRLDVMKDAEGCF